VAGRGRDGLAWESKLSDQKDYAEPQFPVPAIRCTMSVQMPTGRQMGFETVVEQTICAEDFDELVDRMAHVADRQQAKVDLVDHERQLMMAETLLKKSGEDLVQRQAEYRADADPNRRTFRLSQQQKANLEQIQHQIDDLKQQIAVRKMAMAKCRELIYGTPKLMEAAE
jgi:hypothetical protein